MVRTPFPNTGSCTTRLLAEGRILTRNWELYDGQHVVFQPKQMSIGQLQRGVETAWKYAYRYRSIASGALSEILQASRWRSTANLGYRFYAHHLRQFYTCDWFLPKDAFSASTSPTTFVPVTGG